MKDHAYPLALTLVLCAAGTGIAPTAAALNSDQLTRCQKLLDKIHAVTEKRRSGGSGTQMDNWRRQRNQYLEQFSAHNCTRVQHRLRFR